MIQFEKPFGMLKQLDMFNDEGMIERGEVTFSASGLLFHLPNGQKLGLPWKGLQRISKEGFVLFKILDES